jgi:hypothetical protein
MLAGAAGYDALISRGGLDAVRVVRWNCDLLLPVGNPGLHPGGTRDQVAFLNADGLYQSRFNRG